MMKQYPWIGVGIVLLGLAVSAHAAKEMSVQVRTGQLRERPSFLGKVVAEVQYGDRVTVDQAQGPWMQVTVASQSGWIHESALTKSKIRLGSGDTAAPTAASSEELALAGKGFNADVEAEFKAQHKDIDFTWVDRMEGMGLSMDRLVAFLKEGGVKPLEGGR